MENITIIPNNKEVVRVHNNFVNSIFSLSTDAKKLLLAIWLHTNDNGEDIEIYRPDIIEKIGIDLKNLSKEHREKIIEELMTKIITIRDIDNPNNFTKIQLVGKTIYENGILYTKIDKDLLKYIQQAKEKLFTRFNIQNIKPLKSGYAIRIYLLCKQFEDTRFYKNTIKEFKKQLEIENKYKQVSDLKKRVLEVAKKQINKNTDIFIDYELEKKGRSYTHIKFKIDKNPNYKEEELEKEVSTTPPVQNNWNEWRKELLKKGDIIISFNDEIYKLKAGYLFKNDKLLSKENSLELWQKLYENKDNLKIMSEEEYLEEQIKQAEEEERLSKYKGLKLGVLINGEDKEVTIYDIKNNNNSYTLYLQIFPEYTILNKEFSNLEELEEFIKITHTNYKNNIEKYIKKKQPSEEAMKKIEELQKKIKMS